MTSNYVKFQTALIPVFSCAVSRCARNHLESAADAPRLVTLAEFWHKKNVRLVMFRYKNKMVGLGKGLVTFG